MSLCLLCLFVALSFVAPLLPIAGATAGADTMRCCVGKEAGHCDSGILAKKVQPPPPEPMCGLDNSEFEDDGITIVAKPSRKESPHSLSRAAADKTSYAAESNSVSKPCKMECGTCAASSTRQQKRERGIAQPAANHNAFLTVLPRFDNQPFSFSSNENWAQISPRGPPADLR
jgi:hypothetical protein